MKRSTTFVAIIAAVLLTLSSSSATLAQDPVDQEVQSGTTLTTALTAGSGMTAVTFSNVATTSTGTLVLDIEDARGTDAGWAVSVSSTGFVPQGDIAATAPTIPATGFRFNSLADLTATAGDTAGITAGTAGTALDTAQTVVQAAPGSGTGDYTATLGVVLDIPAQAPVGIYQSAVTVSISSAP